MTYADKELSKDLLKAMRKRFNQDIIISEEETPEAFKNSSKKAWVIDPIDGTSNYCINDGMYSVMIGLLANNKPVAGWVYSPIKDRLIIGITGDGIFELKDRREIKKLEVNLKPKEEGKPLKIMMGRRDRKYNPDIKEKIRSFDFVEVGSIGLKVIHILDNEADGFIHTCKQLKIWDTVPSTAIALASGQVVETIEGDEIIFSLKNLRHDQTYAVGKDWAIKRIRQALVN